MWGFITGAISILMGYVLWSSPQVTVGRRSYLATRPVQRALFGQRKQIIAGLLIAAGIISMLLRYPAIAGITIIVAVLAAFLLQEQLPIPPPIRRPQPPRTPTTLTAELRAQLEHVIEKGHVQIDARGIDYRGRHKPKLSDHQRKQKKILETCRALQRMGYLSFSESGPGGSMQIFHPTQKAWTLVKPDEDPAPTSLTPELLEQLKLVIQFGEVQLYSDAYSPTGVLPKIRDLERPVTLENLREKGQELVNEDVASIRDCRILHRMGYLSFQHLGGGKISYSPTQKGRDALG